MPGFSLNKRMRRALLMIPILLVLILLAFYLVLTYKSKEFLEEVIFKVSKGQYKVDVSHVEFFYFHAGIKAEQLKLIPVDSGLQKASVQLEKLEIRLSSLWHLVFNKQLIIQKIEIRKPEIIAHAGKNSSSGKKGISETIKEAQGKLIDLIEVLKVKDCLIEDGAMTIYSADTTQKKFLGINHININLNNIEIQRASKYREQVFKGNGSLTLINPLIQLPDSTMQASVGKLSANIADQSLQIDSLVLLNIEGEKPARNVSLSSVRISGFNWNRYINEEFFEFDSVVAKSGKADIDFLVQKSRALPKSQKVYRGNSFVLHHVFISDIAYNLQLIKEAKKGGNQLLMHLKGDSLFLKELSIIRDRQPAFAVDSLNLGIRDFAENDEGNNQRLSLQGLTISRQSLVLKKYFLEVNKENKDQNYIKVSIPEFKLTNFSLEEIFEKKLSASGMTLVEPNITFDIRHVNHSKRKSPKNINTAIASLTQSLSKKVALGEIVIKNGSFTLLPTLSPKDSVTLTGLSMVIDAAKLPRINNAMDLIQAVKVLNSNEFMITGKNIHLHVRDMKLLDNPRGISLGSVRGSVGQGKSISLNGVIVLSRNLAIAPAQSEGLHISDLTAESGIVTINTEKTNSTKAKSSGFNPIVKIDRLGLDNLIFRMQQGNKLGVSSALTVDADNFEFRNNKVYWSKLAVGAKKTDAAIGKTSFGAGSMIISQPGLISIDQPVGETKMTNGAMSFSADRLDILLGITSSEISRLKIDDIRMTKPILKIISQQAENKTFSKKELSKSLSKAISLDHLELIDPVIDFAMKDRTGVQSHKHQVFTGSLILDNFRSPDGNLQSDYFVGWLRYKTSQPKSVIGDRQLSPSELYISASDLRFNPITNHFNAFIDTVYIRNVSQTVLGKKQDTLQLKIDEAGIANFTFSKEDKLDWKQLIHSVNWWSKGTDVTYFTPKQVIHAWHLDIINDKTVSLLLDSFAILNRKTREEVWASTAYEKGYETLKGGKINALGVQLSFNGEKPMVIVDKLISNALQFTTAKDKTKLADTISYRPLLTRTFLKIPVALYIDSVLINNARVDVHEISRKTKKESNIFFSEINGYINKVKNENISPEDTLDMRLRARFYGTDVVRLHFRQSYYDSLQEFWMRVRMSHFEMPEMNRLLVPLMGLKIHSGTVDSLLLVTKGNDHFAYGTMDLRYHNLKARLLKTEDTKGKMLISIENFFAGLFLRTHDNGRTDVLFKERLKSRSIFNFWGKIALEGLLTNLGVKKDKAEERKFKKNLDKLELPEKYWQEEDQ